MSKYRFLWFQIPISGDLYFSNYWHRLVLKIPFLNHIFSKISKHGTENLHFPSTGKYYALPPPPPPTIKPN